MIIINKANINDVWMIEQKGVWRTCATKDGRTASLSCPECGDIASLSNHSIGDGGVVTPSLVCPYGDCSFHDNVRLQGWTI